MVILTGADGHRVEMAVATLTGTGWKWSRVRKGADRLLVLIQRDQRSTVRCHDQQMDDCELVGPKEAQAGKRGGWLSRPRPRVRPGRGECGCAWLGYGPIFLLGRMPSVTRAKKNWATSWLIYWPGQNEEKT
jgi:hypothetical protein